jgi:hypothetical protein
MIAMYDLMDITPAQALKMLDLCPVGQDERRYLKKVAEGRGKPMIPRKAADKLTKWKAYRVARAETTTA